MSTQGSEKKPATATAGFASRLILFIARIIIFKLLKLQFGKVVVFGWALEAFIAAEQTKYEEPMPKGTYPNLDWCLLKSRRWHSEKKVWNLGSVQDG